MTLCDVIFIYRQTYPVGVRAGRDELASEVGRHFVRVSQESGKTGATRQQDESVQGEHTSSLTSLLTLTFNFCSSAEKLVFDLET